MASPGVVLQFHAVAIVGDEDAIAEELPCQARAASGRGGFRTVMDEAGRLTRGLADGAADRSFCGGLFP